MREKRGTIHPQTGSPSHFPLILGKRQTENGIPVLSESDEWLGGEGMLNHPCKVSQFS